MCNAITSMLFGSYSDLFGRRWFIILGNVIVFAGLIVAGAAPSTDAFIAACTISGLVGDLTTHPFAESNRYQGAGLAQQSCWAVPELLPNRVRHVALVITGIDPWSLDLVCLTLNIEASTWTCVTLGPVAARLAFRAGNAVL